QLYSCRKVFVGWIEERDAPYEAKPKPAPCSTARRRVQWGASSPLVSRRFPMHRRTLLALVAVCLVGHPGPLAAQDIPPMKFNEVREVAPGVFFRYSSISATDPKVAFGGCNNIWVVFDDFVLVYDANFPKEAGDVIAAIKNTTEKPVRYVLDSHH